MNNMDARSTSHRFAVSRLLRRPLGFPIFEFAWLLVFVVGLFAAIVVPLAGRLVQMLQLLC